MQTHSTSSSSNPSYSSSCGSSAGQRASLLPPIAQQRRGSDGVNGPFQATLSASDISESFADSVTVRLPGALGGGSGSGRGQESSAGNSTTFPPPSLAQMGGLEPQQEGDSESDTSEVSVPLPSAVPAGGPGQQEVSGKALPSKSVWFKMFGRRAATEGNGTPVTLGTAGLLPQPPRQAGASAGKLEGGSEEGGPLLVAAPPGSAGAGAPSTSGGGRG
jgi:hypothetical protein